MNPTVSDQMISIARGLLRLKTIGVLANVWIDAHVISVTYPESTDCRRRISAERAKELIAKHADGKREAA